MPLKLPKGLVCTLVWSVIMYEYRTETHYQSTPPSILTPPNVSGPKFRLRDMMFVQTMQSMSHTIGYGGQHSTPHATSSSGSIGGQWVVIWERYVPEPGE